MINNKKNLDNKTISLDELPLEELEDLNKLYRGEVSKLSQEVKALEEENIKLKRLLGK
jgi:FtsZ-binding cell division protein ZapB